MDKEVRWTRWHRFDDNGTKYIKRFELNEIPEPSPKGYTEWCRGTGPLSEEHYNNVVNAIRKSCKGVPKSQEHREKMRLAKLGKPKSEEHRKNMSKAWEKRREKGLGHQSEESKQKQSQTRKQANRNVYLEAMAKLEQLKQGTYQ